ncbi:unnamed protein product [Pieris macdunnoughi]|uniref:C-type lectin domain-containing protein n=1 Tax=Pieris macdunnoughi TaxID=345717 RepID=A0A821XXB8_9NEOP|nr:unnamed protein product [Pieris macdunnoughi]
MYRCIVLTVLLAVIASNDANWFRCDYECFPKAGGYLKLHRIPANWREARLRCHLEGAKIASPLNDELKNAMLSMMDVSLKRKCGVFLGIHATFSRGDFFSVDGVPLSHISYTWADGEPDNYNDAESCLLLTENGEFADVNCEDTYPYFCYKKISNSLVMNSCGTTDPEKHRHSIDMEIVICGLSGIHVAKEIFAKYPDNKIVGNFPKDVAFVGVHDWGEHGEWLTINSDTLQEAGYSKFSPGEPNNGSTGEFCGAIYRNGMYNDLLCESRYVFLCEKDPESLLCEQDQ